MSEVSTLRLYLMRAAYLFISGGLALTIWPQLINHVQSLSLWRGVGCSLLAAISVLAALGIRYPLQMLPVLFFEMIWKLIWLIAVALPLWYSHQVDAATKETIFNCLIGVIVPLAVPWSYVYANYAKKPADKWK
jgi:hypothetical protein